MPELHCYLIRGPKSEHDREFTQALATLDPAGGWTYELPQLWSESAKRPILPAGYTEFRRIGRLVPRA